MVLVNRISKPVLWAYCILVIRIWLAYILCDYGYSKLTDGQFGLRPEELELKVGEIDLFRLSWYLFSHEPFKSFIGWSQIITGLLLVFNRTVVIGALIAIPIWLTILFIDLTFMDKGMELAFTLRMCFYLLLTTVVLLFHSKKIGQVIKAMTQADNTNYRFPFWAYLLIPVFGFCIEFIPVLPRILNALFG